MGVRTINDVSRGRLAAKASVRLLAGFLIVLGVLLLAGGSTAYWQAWVYMSSILAVVTKLLAYLLATDPELLERRLRTKEEDAKQRSIVKLAQASYALVFLIPGLDQRFGWSHVPAAVAIAADALVVLCYGGVVLVLRENRFASRVIEVEQAQKVVTTGPYAFVRHPMYLAMLLIFLFTPVALGSWWALISVLPLAAILVARIRNEEQLLAKELGGYREYMRVTKYRLLPGVW